MKHDTHTQSNSEGDCQLCGNINKKRSFLTLVQLRKCGVWGYFCNIKCDANYIINAPCLTVHSNHSQTLLNSFSDICFIKCSYFSFTFTSMYSKIFHWTSYFSCIFIFLSNCYDSLCLYNLININRISFYLKTLH